MAVAEKRSNELSGQVKASTAAGEQLARERQRLDDELKAANQQVALQRDALTEVKSYRASRTAPSPDLDTEIAKQDRLLAEAQRHVDALASLRERVRT